MKTKTIIASLLTFFFAMQMQAQYGSVNAMNDEISDNLDLRAVASIFGDSRNLQDFERRLNDPKIQISNLDLNYDNQVDYLRVIETVDRNTHLIIIQSVLDRDVYQDVATIDVERDNYNRIQVQFVGNEYLYGPNYIYEPVYYSSPLIYASFCVSNYRPYVSSWYWNYYPSYYYAWRPYPIYRYRSNIHVSINFNNSYNYVNYRRSNYAPVLYSSRRSNGYARLYPEQSFSRRNSSVNNRYELDQRRSSRSLSSRNESDAYRNGTSRYTSPYSGSSSSSRNYSQNRSSTSRESAPQSSRDYSQNKNSSTRGYSSQSSPSSRDYSQNKSSSSREYSPQSSSSSRDYSQNKSSSTRGYSSQSSPSSRDYSQNKSSSSREYSPQPSSSSRDYSQNKSSSARQAAPQSAPSQSRSSESRPSSSREMKSQDNGRGSSSNSVGNRRN
ncbi:hypothetical protein SLW70_07160 [Flavobacterium sp. NG2]|uniref:hypothetical protein n=1 Tax=Flavobacterium sp. NG2 TaxID=3097547 RepID=UPI002A810BDB|nr:hypothetical protein [Flavobacterium sp. NG2]WPR72891.1 hypothetical protein SLW70_07160 [Flavobacterium sp. NG2]